MKKAIESIPNMTSRRPIAGERARRGYARRWHPLQESHDFHSLSFTCGLAPCLVSVLLVLGG